MVQKYAKVCKSCSCLVGTRCWAYFDPNVDVTRFGTLDLTLPLHKAMRFTDGSGFNHGN